MTLCPPVSDMCKEVGAFDGGDVGKNGGDSVVDSLAGAPSGVPQPVLELGEEHLDGIEVWGVLGQEEEPGAHGADGGADCLAAVRSKIVHDDDVAWHAGWGEDLFDIEKEALAINRSFDQPGRHDPVVSQSGDEGQGLPAAMRNLGQQAPAAGCPAA